MNDKEARTQFTHVANLGGKNVYKIFAGGNHSWVVIDDNMPVRCDYRPPSPVGYDEASAMNISPRLNQNDQKTNNAMLGQKAMKKRKYELQLSVTYTDTSMCHRFITFEFARNSHD